MKREDTRESLDNALNILIDPELAKDFETSMKELMKSYEMLKGDLFLRDYLLDYTWLVKVYIAYNKKFKKASVNELKIGELSRKTIKLIQETINVEEIDDAYPTVSVDEKYVEVIKKSVPKTIRAAIDIITNTQYEARTHPTSQFFIDISKEVKRTYEELRNRRIETEEALQRLLNISERVVRWKKEEKEIGRDKYPIYEAMKTVIPKIGKQRVIAFIDTLLAHLENKKLLFKGWQLQGVMR